MVVSEIVFLSLDCSCFLLTVTKMVKYGVFEIFWSFLELYLLSFSFLLQFCFCRKNLESFLQRYWPPGWLASIDIFGLHAGNFGCYCQSLLHCILNLDSCMLWWKSAICRRCSWVERKYLFVKERCGWNLMCR